MLDHRLYPRLAIATPRQCRACAGSGEKTTMTRARICLVVAATAAAALVGVALYEPRLTAAGWLLALTYISAFPIGSLALLMIHRLTGGRWGEALEPFLRPLSRTTPCSCFWSSRF